MAYTEPMARYFLRSKVNGSQDIDLPEARYRRAMEAQSLLALLFKAEELYSVLLENYATFEREQLSYAIDFALFSSEFRTDLVDARSQLNRHLVNLLSTCRMYFDQVSSLAKRVNLEQISLDTMFASWRTVECDGFLSYRVMEALRNYSQHNGLPIHGITHSMKRVGAEAVPDQDMQHAVELKLDLARLKGDGKFKAQVLNELLASNQTDLKDHTRQYVECISRIQGKWRDITSERANFDSSVIDGVMEVGYGDVNHHMLGIEAIAIDDEGIATSIMFSVEGRNRLKRLQAKYRVNIPVSKIKIIGKTT